MRRTKRNQGFSLIEVMTAVVVMIVCSTGIAAMVNATSRANEDGWETSVAGQFGSTWLERVKRDALLWTAAGTPGLTNYLSNVGAGWFVPNPGAGAPQESWAATAFGRDTRVNANMHFCVNMQAEQVHQLVNGLTNAIRVDLRVFWNRTARGDANVVNRVAGPFAPGAGCGTPLNASTPLIREVYMSTVVHWIAVTP